MADDEAVAGILIGAGIALGLIALLKILDAMDEEEDYDDWERFKFIITK